MLMNLHEIEKYCLSKSGAFLDYPFGPETAIIKVKSISQETGRIFAQLFILRGEAKVTLNCDRETGDIYRTIYPGTVTRGYHCPPIQQPYFNTITLDDTVPEDELLGMIDHSYTTVVGKLPKKYQKELEDTHED